MTLQIDLRDYESKLGTPSSQKILNILICWKILPIKEIIELSGLSDSQVYLTIKNLETLYIVKQESRGIYSLTENQYTLNLEKAYTSILNRMIGQRLHYLSKNYEKMDLDDYVDELVELNRKWGPLVRKNFQSQYSRLAGHLIG